MLNGLGNKFKIKLAILNFRTKLNQQRHFQSKKENNENHNQILHIRISLGSICWNKFPKKGYFRLKTKKMNITTQLFLF